MTAVCANRPPRGFANFRFGVDGGHRRALGECRNWAESVRTRVAFRRSGSQAKATTQLRMQPPKRSYASRDSRDRASAISGISGIGEKPSSAREDRVGVGGAAGRLIQLGEGECRVQFEAASPLLFRDDDGGAERF